MAQTRNTLALPLFPLQAVLFPSGLLSMKVFESRYLDLVSTCMREEKPFGVVRLLQGSEVASGGSKNPVSFEPVGVVADLMEVDAAHANILQVRCRGRQRFEVRDAAQGGNGLWTAQVRLLPYDEIKLPTPELIEAARGLANAIATLKQQGSEPFLKPFHFEDAGWVANRWCEILPIPVSAKQKLMELADPLARLQLVANFLRDKGVVK